MRSFLTLSALILGTTQAGATLPPCEIDALMREAPTVVQIRNPSPAFLGDNMCQFSGVVVAVHRGDVQLDDYLTVTFDCVTTPSQVDIGATVYTDPMALGTSGMVEAHIDADGHIAANGFGLFMLEAPTDAIAWEPYCNG